MTSSDSSETTDEGVASRGAQKRQQAKVAREREQALRWWTQPGVLIFFSATLLAALGWGLVLQASRKITVREATIGGLHLKLNQARWVLDQMDHGENYEKPAVMMSDMPEVGKQRVTLELAFQNRTQESRAYDGSEFFLVPEIGDAVPPIGAQTGHAVLGPGQSLNTAIHFDFDTSMPHGKLRVEWRRGDESVYLPVPEPADHYHLRPRDGEQAFPPDARMVVPLGKAARGESLYNALYGCVACHGEINVPGSNNVGPHLGSIGATAAARVEGMSAAQYIYDSIIEPSAVIAPECKDGRPCQEPTSMPEYASLVTLQHLADLVAFLLEQTEPVGAEAAEATEPSTEP